MLLLSFFVILIIIYPFVGLSHCHECDLSTNLWLCLVCGNVGCGRKNYDGSGGNGHAATHSKTAHHCLVVKLGTITAEGKRDF